MRDHVREGKRKTKKNIMDFSTSSETGLLSVSLTLNTPDIYTKITTHLHSRAVKMTSTNKQTNIHSVKMNHQLLCLH